MIQNVGQSIADDDELFCIIEEEAAERSNDTLRDDYQASIGQLQEPQRKESHEIIRLMASGASNRREE